MFANENKVERKRKDLWQFESQRNETGMSGGDCEGRKRLNVTKTNQRQTEKGFEFEKRDPIKGCGSRLFHGHSTGRINHTSTQQGSRASITGLETGQESIAV